MHSMGAHMAHLHRMNDDLRVVLTAAKTLIEECEDGMRSPSLGVLARLESALHIEWKSAALTTGKSEHDDN